MGYLCVFEWWFAQGIFSEGFLSCVVVSFLVFLRYFHTVLHSGWVNLHSYQSGFKCKTGFPEGEEIPLKDVVSAPAQQFQPALPGGLPHRCPTCLVSRHKCISQLFLIHFFLKKKKSIIEISFTYHIINPFKIFSSVGFDYYIINFWKLCLSIYNMKFAVLTIVK